MKIFENLDDFLLILDKPPKLTSHEVSALIKKLFNAKKCGHAGTLDPNVTGVLPIAFNRGTKLLQFISAEHKTYVGIMKFKNEISTRKVKELFKKFSGEIIQTPPKISAVKKAPRKRTVFYIKMLEKEGKLVLFEAKVEHGTYIRTLCEDIGKEVGGAKMVELRRIKVGEIDESLAVKIQDIVDALWLCKEKGECSLLSSYLHSIDKFLHFPKIFIKKSAARNLIKGAQLAKPGVISFENFNANDFVSFYLSNGTFVGIGKALFSSEEIKSMEKGIITQTLRIHLTEEKLKLK